MQFSEALEAAQDEAAKTLSDQFDHDLGFPIRAESHSDLWPGDRWAEAYTASGNSNHAYTTLESVGRSIRPDGGVPHLMQGSHKYGGIETRFIDRQVYRLEGSGAVKLDNGEWVTKLYAPPTLALSALAIARTIEEVSKPLSIDTVAKASDSIYAERTSPASNGLVVATHPNELTNNSGKLALDLKGMPAIVDPSINALLVQNNAALAELYRYLDAPVPEAQSERAARTYRTLVDKLRNAQDRPSLTNEEVLAIARMGGDLRLTEEQLAHVFAEPEASEKHLERTRLNMAECLEVARLTPYAAASNDYLARVLPKVAQAGKAAITRFEGLAPGKNPVTNKANRKQIWVPTAAEIVQIDARNFN